ncbi:hypothetical protein BHM03_00025620 [Ensete ventricosum]|uniref:Uncharacterized protein n=1 Tax=Ensete ventricosum TaxID=4639 RepID=A0A445MH04_ENSVE|nr:hypothetical protein BHM03_00025620 [Ensete ventricosum]
MMNTERNRRKRRWRLSEPHDLLSLLWFAFLLLYVHLVKDSCSVLQIQKSLPKVNRLLAACLHIAEESEMETMDDTVAKKKSKKNRGLTSEILRDTCFAAMFENKVYAAYILTNTIGISFPRISRTQFATFEVDELSQEFLSLHPQSFKKQPSLIEERFEPVKEDWEEQGTSDSDASIASQESEDELDTDENEVKNFLHMFVVESVLAGARVESEHLLVEIIRDLNCNKRIFFCIIYETLLSFMLWESKVVEHDVVTAGAVKGEEIKLVNSTAIQLAGQLEASGWLSTG